MTEYLKILDMPKHEQDRFLMGYIRNMSNATQADLDYRQVLEALLVRGFPTLAFRLRDEAVMLKSFQCACAEVYNQAHGFELGKSETHAPTIMVWVWFATHAQPIHWIVAALIAGDDK